MTIAWTERLSIDRGIIDQDHRVLIDLCNAFINGNCEADRKGLAEILSDLEHYARSHFWREGELQRKIRFCYAGQQSEEHLALVKTLGDIAMEFFRAKEGSDFYRVTQEIRALLRSWLIDHILKSDIHMAAYRSEISALARDMKPLAEMPASAAARTIGSEILVAASIDNGVIDQDHRKLAEIINAFIIGAAENADRAYLSATLAELMAYTSSHFKREEDLQAAVGFPFAAAHHQAHESLIASLGGFEAKLASSGVNLAVMRVEMSAMLKRWLLDHIGEQDARMRDYVKEMRGPALKMRPIQRAMNW